jgi:hypothetical protein
MSVDHIHLVGADGSSMMLRYDQRDGWRHASTPGNQSARVVCVSW